MIGCASPASAQRPTEKPKHTANIYRLQSTSSSPLAVKATAFIEDALKKLYKTGDDISSSPETVHGSLPRTSNALVFIIGDRRTVTQLSKIDSGFGRLETLKVDVVNARSAAVPFYVFALQSTVDQLRSNPQRKFKLAYGVTDRTQSFATQEAAEVFRPLPWIDVVGSSKSPRDLLGWLLADGPEHVDLIGIYDDEPSLILDDFLSEYRTQRPAIAGPRSLRLVFFPSQYQVLGPQLRIGSKQGSTYAFAHYDKLSFHGDLFNELFAPGPSDGLLTLVTPSLPMDVATDAPVVLSNVRSIVGPGAAASEFTKIRQVVSYAYLAALLTDEGMKRCGANPSPLFESYLLKALLSDGDNIAKSLSLLSNLELTPGTDAPSADAVIGRELIENMVLDRLRTLNINATTESSKKTSRIKIDSNQLAKKLLPAGIPLSVRQKFSGDYSTVFHGVVTEIGGVVQNRLAARPEELKLARGALVLLLEKQAEPACLLRGAGLFAEKGFDPFLYLGVIDSLLAFQSPD